MFGTVVDAQQLAVYPMLLHGCRSFRAAGRFSFWHQSWQWKPLLWILPTTVFICDLVWEKAQKDNELVLRYAGRWTILHSAMSLLLRKMPKKKVDVICGCCARLGLEPIYSDLGVPCLVHRRNRGRFCSLFFCSSDCSQRFYVRRPSSPLGAAAKQQGAELLAIQRRQSSC